MRNDEAGLGLASNNHISQISVVRFDIALPGSEREAL